MSWDGMRVLVIGAARQGVALTRYLLQQGAVVVLNDARSLEELADARQALEGLPVIWETGGHPVRLLEGADLVCPSGGVPLTIPLVHEARRIGIPLSNDSQIFMEVVPSKVAGITGSAGKTTTTTLVGRMAEKAVGSGRYGRVFVGGNIGKPLISELDQITADDLCVAELSSFQLETMTVSPQVAAVLNISPNHLDRHVSMENYITAKQNIYRHQTPADTLVVGHDDPVTRKMAAEAKGEVMTFGLNLPEGLAGTFIQDGTVMLRQPSGLQEVIGVSDISLRGEHNLRNVLAACALAAALDLPAEAMRAGVIGFSGVEHRLEFVRELNGVPWYNDSKATSPGMSVTAMKGFTEPLVVLAGGRDKDLPWDEFARQAGRQTRKVIAFGEAGELVAAALRAEAVSHEVVPGLAQAVEAAALAARDGDVVLLAPGGTSFDEFEDYEHRGRFFKRLVLALPEKEQSA